MKASFLLLLCLGSACTSTPIAVDIDEAKKLVRSYIDAMQKCYREEQRITYGSATQSNLSLADHVLAMEEAFNSKKLNPIDAARKSVVAQYCTPRHANE